ncbi:MAG TPA: M1 family aminopeptidase [Thermoanaerobaculia bacterium]|nr:M1 family aminopeptidase [Thermoanaerobaculia bacterium]
MRIRRTLLLLFTFVLLVNARQRAVQHPAGKPFSDTFSYSEPLKVTTRHLVLDLTIEPAIGRLHGNATLHIENLSGTRTLILDSYELQISQVKRDGVPTAWSLGQKSDVGQPLIIEIEPTTTSVSIDYATTFLAQGIPGTFGPALFWLPAEGTLAGEKPFVYSLNEPIGARTWMPVQDNPAVRMSYEAMLHVPPGLMALMSAEGNSTIVNDMGFYAFQMPHPIPAYLIAFAVGRLEFHALDDRMGVYAEPELLDEAVWELQSLPEMMDIAEEIAGPFPFERHDVLIMAPGFPAGGMEHPMLNFISSTLVLGDHVANPPPKRTIAHELAHSWAGDATSLSNWNDVWLNEGFATYLAHRILEEMREPELTELAWADERRSFEFFADLLPISFSILHRQVTFPAEAFDSTGYGKGALFARTLEDHLGRPRFDQFLKDYFQTMRWHSLDSPTFLAVFKELVQADAQLLANMSLEEWVYQPGVPANITAPATSAINTRMQPRINAFIAGTPIAQLSPGSWSETEINLFLAATRTQTRARMAEVDTALSLSTMHTPPRTWLLDVIMVKYEPGMAAVERVLMRGTPHGWLIQLYEQLHRWNATRGREIFQRARAGYLPYHDRQIALLLGITSGNVRSLKNAA